MILNESTVTGHGKIDQGVPKGLPELIGICRQEIRERAEEINAAETVRRIGPQSHAIHRCTSFPKVFPVCARVRVGSLIVIFATLAVSCIGPTKRDQPRDVNFGS